MNRFLIPLSLTAGAVLLTLAGCGNKDTGVDATTLDSKAGAMGSTALGSAMNGGLNSLYSGGSVAYAPDSPEFRLAWQPSPQAADSSMADVPSGVFSVTGASVAGGGSTDTPPSPTPGAGQITPTNYPDPLFTSGAINYSSDTTGLPANWYHVQLGFSSAQPFVITDQDGDTATIVSGQVDIYVHNQDLANDGLGNWTRQADVYTSIPSGTPITVAVSLANGNSRTATLSGLRHAQRHIVRTKSTSGPTTTIGRTDNALVDGDFSALATAAPAITAANGPSMNDHAGASHPFTRWTHNVTSAAGSHSLVWDRYATWTVSWTSTSGGGSTTWDGSLTNVNENIYVQRDGGAVVGPMNDLELHNRYHILHNLNRAAQYF